MKSPSQPDRLSLAARMGGGLEARTMADAGRSLTLAQIVRGSILRGLRPQFAGRNVMLATNRQMEAAAALVELDGLAARILLSPPDLAPEFRPMVIADAGIDAVVTDAPDEWRALGVELAVAPQNPPVPEAGEPPVRRRDTHWLMLTSGTTGRPKIVAHSLDALTGAIGGDKATPQYPPVWATFYDVRRYGGLQILLRALIGGGSIVLSEPGEPLVEHLQRLIAADVTHISGTPSHWRKALMTDTIQQFHPRYVRLSGEIADQAVLDGLKRAFPAASIGHAYASTEAGVGFAVDDGLEGFPAAYVENPGPVAMKVVDGTLHIRSARAALAYIGEAAPPLCDAEGYVDTGDMVERRGERFYFVGRRGGIMNIGGLKVHPEEVEAALNSHPAVRMSRVKARKSSITGAIVVGEIVPAEPVDPTDAAQVKAAILAHCRSRLPAHKVPAMVSFVEHIEMSPGGKLVRHGS